MRKYNTREQAHEFDNIKISNFIPTQFPSFYEDDGTDYIRFVSAYYEWMELQKVYHIKLSELTPVPVAGATLTSLDHPGLLLLVLSSDPETYSVQVLKLCQCNIETSGKIIETLYPIESQQTTGLPGTVSVYPNAYTVTGTNTTFKTHYKANDYIKINGQYKRIVLVRNNTSLKVSTPFLAPLPSNATYTQHRFGSPLTIFSWKQIYNPVALMRSLKNNTDIDFALDQFIEYFRNEYLLNIPNDIKADKRLLIKHILDLYRSKGTPKSYELLFRIVFNEDITLYFPKKDLFAPSDNSYVIPRYIEVSDSPYLTNLIGKEIKSSSLTGTAIVEQHQRKTVNGRVVNILSISNLKGEFPRGDYILCDEYIYPTEEDNAKPFVLGSLKSISIIDGGLDYEVGDFLDVNYASGISAKARVTATKNENGKVSFEILDGGSGYSKDALVSVTGGYGTGATFKVGSIINKETYSINTDIIGDYDQAKIVSLPLGYQLGIANASGAFSNGEYLTQSANLLSLDVEQISFGVVQNGETISNTSLSFSATIDRAELPFIRMVNHSSVIPATGTTLKTGTSNVLLTVKTLVSAEQITANGQIYSANATHLLVKNVYSMDDTNHGITSVSISSAGQHYANGDIVSFTTSIANTGHTALALVETNTSGNIVAVHVRNATGSIPGCYRNGGTLNTPSITTANGSGATLSATVGYFGSTYLLGATISGSSSGVNAKVVSRTELTDWNFPTSDVDLRDNTDNVIDVTLQWVLKEVGTIKTLAAVAPGIGYSANPEVTVLEPLIANLDIRAENGGIKGKNAVIRATAGTGKGVVTAIEIADSGFGFYPNEYVSLQTTDNPVSVKGVTVVDSPGKSFGYLRNKNGFLSSHKYVQDSDYWQRYSYEIASPVLFEGYRKLVLDIVHPAGYKLFGKFVHSRKDLANRSVLTKSAVTQS